jgi:hydrogenase nickel incorporation protein HypA/HybF
VLDNAPTYLVFFKTAQALPAEAGAATMAGVEVGALRFALEALRHGSCLESARIEIDEVPGRAWCEPCAAEVRISSRADPCPQCGGYPVRVLGGDRLRVMDLLVHEQEART